MRGSVTYRSISTMVILALAFIYLLSGIYFIAPEEEAVVKRFGRVVHEGVTPGIHYRLPYPFEKEYKLMQSWTVKGSSTKPSLTKTRQSPAPEVKPGCYCNRPGRQKSKEYLAQGVRRRGLLNCWRNTDRRRLSPGNGCT